MQCDVPAWRIYGDKIVNIEGKWAKLIGIGERPGRGQALGETLHPNTPGLGLLLMLTDAHPSSAAASGPHRF